MGRVYPHFSERPPNDFAVSIVCIRKYWEYLYPDPPYEGEVTFELIQQVSYHGLKRNIAKPIVDFVKIY